MTAARACGLLFLVSGIFSVYPSVARLLIIRGGFYPWLLSANLPLIFVVAAVALIAGAILLRRILAARFSTSTESNLVPALLIAGAVISLLAVGSQWAINQVVQDRQISGLALRFLESPIILYVMALPMLKHACYGLAIAALIPLQRRLGGGLKTTAMVSVALVVMVHMSVANGLFLFLHQPWPLREATLLVLFPLIGSAVPIWLILTGVVLIAWKSLGDADDAADASRFPTETSQSETSPFQKIGGISMFLVVITVVLSVIVRSVSPDPAENLAVSRALHGVGGVMWAGAGASLMVAAYCLWREISAYRPIPSGIDCTLLAAAGLSLLCIGIVQLRTAYHLYDSKKNLIISTGAVTAAVSLAVLLISTLAFESWGTVAGIILLVWFTVFGFALSKGWVHTAPGTEPQHLETTGSRTANRFEPGLI